MNVHGDVLLYMHVINTPHIPSYCRDDVLPS